MEIIAQFVGFIVITVTLTVLCLYGIKGCTKDFEQAKTDTVATQRVRDSLTVENLRLENEKLRLQLKHLESDTKNH